jgi:hypothetical protein
VFQHGSKTSNKKRALRSLKQIVVLERALQWGEDFLNCKLTRIIEEHCEKTLQYRRSQVVTAVTMNITVFWDVTLCHLIDHTDISEKLAASIFRIE